MLTYISYSILCPWMRRGKRGPCTDVPGEGSCFSTAAPLSLSDSTHGRWVWERKLSICGTVLWRTPPAFSKLCSGKVLSVLHPLPLSHRKPVLVPIREPTVLWGKGVWFMNPKVTYTYLYTHIHTETKHNIMENPLKILNDWRYSILSNQLLNQISNGQLGFWPHVFNQKISNHPMMSHL